MFVYFFYTVFFVCLFFVHGKSAGCARHAKRANKVRQGSGKTITCLSEKDLFLVRFSQYICFGEEPTWPWIYITGEDDI
jgi:hypothetical protein